MKIWTGKNNKLTVALYQSMENVPCNKWNIYFILLSCLLVFPASVTAQGWYWGSPIAPGYDRSSVVEISCVIVNVDVVPRSGPSTLEVRSGEETLTVTLGPEWYLRRIKADFKPGDRLNVRGSKMKAQDGKFYLAAATIKNLRTGGTIEFRDENGRPLWSSKRRLNKKSKP